MTTVTAAVTKQCLSLQHNNNNGIMQNNENNRASSFTMGGTGSGRRVRNALHVVASLHPQQPISEPRRPLVPIISTHAREQLRDQQEKNHLLQSQRVASILLHI